MSTLRIQLFGKFNVQRDAQVVKGLAAPKEQQLLSYLLIHRNRSHPRETLASVLWADTSTERSKKHLRQALWRIQTALDSGDSASPQLVVVDHDWVKLNMQSNLELDVEVFEQAFNATQGMPGNKLNTPKVELLKNAVDLYKSDLLDGWYPDWCLFERERLQNMYLSMLHKLMSYSEEHHEYETGLCFGSMILRYDRAQERTYRQLMHLHHMAGDRIGALRQYERCVTALDEELGVKPERRTTELYEHIRDDEDSKPKLTKVRSAPTASVPLPEVLIRLKRLQSILNAVQRRIQRDVTAVEQGLKMWDQ